MGQNLHSYIVSWLAENIKFGNIEIKTACLQQILFKDLHFASFEEQ